MPLEWRAAEPRDFPACAALLRGRAAYDADLVERLPPVWRRLHREQAAIAAVVEEPQEASPVPILGFGLSVFVDDRFMREARAAREPYVTARVIRGELSGASPVLRLPAIRRVNAAEGLNVVILHYAEAPAPLAPEVRRLLRFTLFEAFIAAHRGYRLKEILQEFWDEIEPEYVVKGWGRVRGDYADWFRSRGLALPPAGRRPYLVGITRDEALAAPGSPMASLFVHAPPRFGFTPAEQRLLGEALHGRTDAELAHALGVRPTTVKARWRTIYDRVDAVAGALMPASADGRDSSSRRGPEKRRRLLEHLRQHPEELRPSLPRRR
jgi:DNA-binding CsgD family transcriptional regulator